MRETTRQALVRVAIVIHFRRDLHRGRAGAHLRAHESAPVRHVHRVGLGEPHVPVDAHAFVEPALAERGVRPHHQHVPAAEGGQIGDVETERRIPAHRRIEVVAVEHDDGIAEHAVEFQRDAPAGIGGGQVEDAPVPADAGRRIIAAQRIRAVVGERARVFERQLDGPIVRQIDLLPGTVVELRIGRRHEAARLGEGAGVGAEAEVLGRIVGVAQVKPPAEIEQQPLPAGAAGGLLRLGLRIRRALPRRRGRGRDAGFKQISACPIAHFGSKGPQYHVAQRCPLSGTGGCATQPSQPVERHNGRMGFAARLLLVIAVAAGLLGAQSGAPTVQSETAPNAKALMARGVQAYDARNDSVALGIFRQAAAMGDVDAMMYLGVMYGTGRGVNLDYATAMAWFRHAADAENSQAMCNIGLLYLQGLGLPKSYSEAMTWFGKAASFGNAEAMFNVGVLYRDGLGVPVNYAEAMKWFRRAAGEGDITAANAIGVLYQQGLGVPVDYAESMSWYRRAADAGNDTAMYNVGVLWEGGLGVTQDRDQAIAWYRKAAAAGNEPAKAALKSLGVKD